MSDKPRRHAALAEVRLLERQDHRELVHAPPDASNPPGRPRPELRGDVVEHGAARRLDRLGHRQVQRGRVHQDRQVGRPLGEHPPDPPDEQPRVPGHPDGPDQHGRSRGQVVNGPAPGRLHLRPGHPEHLGFRQPLAKHPDQLSRMLIPARLGRGDEDAGSLLAGDAR